MPVGCMGETAARRVMERDVQDVHGALKVGDSNRKRQPEDGAVMGTSDEVQLNAIMGSRARLWSGNFRAVMYRSEHDW